jgi:hypothetical protein
MKLLNPIPNGKTSNSMFSKSVEISSYNSDLIFSPAQGTIVSSDKFKCDGNIKIEHYIDGNTYYSNFCKVNRIMSIRGSQVKQEKKKEVKKTDYESKKEIPNPFMDALLSPFSLLTKAFKKESVIMNDNLVKEDINKIKKLIK